MFHLVVKHPYSAPYLPTKWWSNFVKSALGANHELAHVYEYQGIFSDIVADNRKKNPHFHRQIEAGVPDKDIACEK
jgi:hypothetical protein